MVKPLVVTTMFTGAVWAKLSLKVAVHEPAATPVTVYVAVGPLLFEVVMVALPLQLSISPNGPL
jgi:hypothetical protein